MRIIARRVLRAFWEQHPDAEQPLLAWYREVQRESWKTSVEIKAKYRSASFVKGNRVIFNIKGNDYRLVVKVNYQAGIVYIRFIGTHDDYDDINVEEV